MTRYFFNEGAFDSLHGGMRDSTIHVLRFADATRLFVDRRPLQTGDTPRDLAVARTELEARNLAKLTILTERDGASSFDVAAYFRDGDELLYQLRRHFLHPPSAFTFTLRGPVSAQAAIDGRMDQLFATLRVRPDA